MAENAYEPFILPILRALMDENCTVLVVLLLCFTIDAARKELANLSADELDRLRRKLWRYSWISKIAGGKDMDDFLHDAVEKLMSGTRLWYCNSNQKFTDCLYWIVRSDISHCYQSCIRKDNPGLPENDHQWHTNIFGENSDADHKNQIEKACDAGVEELISAEKTPPPDLREKILSYVADKPLMKKLVECRLDSEEKIRADELAVELDVDVKTIYNLNRALKRRLKNSKILNIIR